MGSVGWLRAVAGVQWECGYDVGGGAGGSK